MEWNCFTPVLEFWVAWHPVLSNSECLLPPPAIPNPSLLWHQIKGRKSSHTLTPKFLIFWDPLSQNSGFNGTLYLRIPNLLLPYPAQIFNQIALKMIEPMLPSLRFRLVVCSFVCTTTSIQCYWRLLDAVTAIWRTTEPSCRSAVGETSPSCSVRHPHNQRRSQHGWHRHPGRCGIVLGIHFACLLFVKFLLECW